MARVHDQSTIDDLKRNCPGVDVDAEYKQAGWKIIGRKRGETAIVIDIRQLYLKTAKAQFLEAYGKLITMGVVKK